MTYMLRCFRGNWLKAGLLKQKKLTLSGSFCLLHLVAASDRSQIVVEIAQKYVQALRTEQRSNLQPQASSGLKTYLQLLIIHPVTLSLTLISAKQRLG